jgi:hypothetical protein
MNKNKVAKGLCGLVGIVALAASAPAVAAGCTIGIGTGPGTGTGGPVGPTDPVLYNCQCDCYWPGNASVGADGWVTEDPPYPLCDASSPQQAQMQCDQHCIDDYEQNPIYAQAPPQCNSPALVTNTGMMCTSGTSGQALHASSTPQSSDLVLDRGSSTAVVSLFGQSTNVTIGGSMEFAGGCQSGTCSISLTSIALTATSFSGSLAGVAYTVSGIKMENVGTAAGTEVNGVITIPAANVQMLVNATVNGVPYSGIWSPDQDIHGSYVPNTGQFVLSGDFSHSGTDLGFSFTLQSASMSRPPVANAGRAQTITIPARALTGTATLDGTLSSDLDGNLLGINWYEGTTYLGTGRTLSHSFTVGRHTVTAVAWDTTDKFTSANTTVTIQH